MYTKINLVIARIYVEVRNNATLSELDRKFPDIPLKDISFTAVTEVLSPSFWCDEKPCEQKLFDNFNKIPSNVTYELYAFHLEYIPHIRKIRFLNVGYDMSYIPCDFNERILSRINELTNTFQVSKYPLENRKRTLFNTKINRLLSELARRETLLSTDDYNGRRYDCAPSNFRMQDTKVVSHSYSILRSIDGSTWYLITNSGVMKVDRLKIVLDGKMYQQTLNQVITESFWHEKISYQEDIQNLIPRIKPILLSDYNRKRIKDPNSPRPTPGRRTKKLHHRG
ncbi:hypothetical protein SNEBB_009679 [Seison nebaliae]|nr:hypothetical protein SNEBB_009679 [Seison nebaliae]